MTKSLVLAFCLVVPRIALAGPISFTVTGEGGQSGPVAGLGSNSFWYADIAGGVSANAFASTGFTLLPGFTDTGLVHQGIGSFLISSPFVVGAGESISVDASILSGEHYYWTRDTVGFVALLKDGQVDAVLAAMMPGATTTWTEDSYYATIGQREFNLPSTTAGVQLTHSYIEYPSPIQFGGRTYNATNGGLNGPCEVCQQSFTSEYVPGAGTYSILAGIFVLPYANGATNENQNVAIAITNVSVPEPGVLALLGLGFGVIGLARRRSRER